MKTIVTIEARMSSSRLPGKVLLEVCGKPILEHIVDRLRRCSEADEVVVATTVNPKDDAIEDLCTRISCPYFRGSEPDVLDRLIQTAKRFNGEIICQATGDCPLIDPAVCDQAIQLYKNSSVDYVSNRLRRTYPTGVDPQVFSRCVLERVAGLTQSEEDREHGSYYIYTHPNDFTMKNFEAPDLNCPEKRWLLDYPEDFEFTRAVYEELYPQNPKFTMYDVLELLRREPRIAKLNAMHSVTLTQYPYYESLPSAEMCHTRGGLG